MEEKPASGQTEGLEAFAVWRRRAALGRVRLPVAAEHVAYLEQTAEEKLAAGFMEGPFETEDNGTTYFGQVMVDTATGEKKVFSGRVPLALLRRREQLVSEQITCQIEPYAMMALCWMPKDTLVGRRTVWWVDSEAARFSMIKGQSPSPVMRWLVR